MSASKVHPLKRPSLRQWFDRTADFDEVIFWRLDRFVRRTFPDWAEMVSWAAENEIGLVSATEDLDLSGPLQRLMATMLATVAEMESLNTSRRVSESHDYLRRMKRWAVAARLTGTRSLLILTARARCWQSTRPLRSWHGRRSRA